ncbi:MAG: general secretion pathway protein GspK [Candidatus Binatia bacterium]
MDLSDDDKRLVAMTEEIETRDRDRKNKTEGWRSLSQISVYDDRGFALVIVLWIFIFLFVVAFDFAASVREEGTAAYRFAEESEGYYLAVAGFEGALYELLQQGSQQRERGGSPATDLFDGSWREGKLGQGLYRVRILDEAGKVSLNRADEETLGRVLTHLGVEESRRTVLVDSILDWRDEDNLHRVNGAEDDYYLSLSPPYTARNGPFDSVEDLLWVRGVTPELFYGGEEEGVVKIGLKEIFTVDNPLDRVNLRTASAQVIHALTGLSLDRSRAFVEERKRLSEDTLSDLLRLLGFAAGDASMRQFVFLNPTVVAVESMGSQGESSSRRQVRGVVRIVGGNRGVELIRWVDRVYSEN